MPSKKPKIQAYVSKRLYNAVAQWKAQHGIEGDSEAIERLLSQALDLPSDRDIPHEALVGIYQRLDELDARLGKSRWVGPRSGVDLVKQARSIEGFFQGQGEYPRTN